MEVMKLLLQLSEELQAAQGEKAGLREKVDDVDQAVAQILGEIQKTAAKCSHGRYRQLLSHRSESCWRAEAGWT